MTAVRRRAARLTAGTRAVGGAVVAGAAAAVLSLAISAGSAAALPNPSAMPPLPSPVPSLVPVVSVPLPSTLPGIVGPPPSLVPSGALPLPTNSPPPATPGPTPAPTAAELPAIGFSAATEPQGSGRGRPSEPLAGSQVRTPGASREPSDPARPGADSGGRSSRRATLPPLLLAGIPLILIFGVVALQLAVGTTWLPVVRRSLGAADVAERDHPGQSGSRDRPLRGARRRQWTRAVVEESASWPPLVAPRGRDLQDFRPRAATDGGDEDPSAVGDPPAQAHSRP